MLFKDRVSIWLLCILETQVLPSLPFQKGLWNTRHGRDHDRCQSCFTHLKIKTIFVQTVKHLQSPIIKTSWIFTVSSVLKSSQLLSEISSQPSNKIGKTQPDILGISKVKISVKKNHFYLKDDNNLKSVFKYVKQDKNLSGSASLQITNEKPMQIICFSVNSLKQSKKRQVSLSKTVHIKMEKTYYMNISLLVLGCGKVWT